MIRTLLTTTAISALLVGGAMAQAATTTTPAAGTLGYTVTDSALSAVSNTATAKVIVQGGVFSDKAYIVGKIYADCNANGLQDEKEVGVPGVRLFLEDGTSVISDSEGKYSLYGITARTHVLKVDRSTLPAGAKLKALGNRGMKGDNRFVDLKNGELHRADFALEVMQVHFARGDRYVVGSERDVARLPARGTPQRPPEAPERAPLHRDQAAVVVGVDARVADTGRAGGLAVERRAEQHVPD